ncbi:GAF domain-containing protein [Klenkia soli]|uniref:protein-serine/threonine phosphatase n=1 Tax=Klenkia soli TaxID=1052260 RepID=A0A1H0KZ64_9ACTN|nr:SpoIIE family protein phosphatase [Klenkia soli]SDO61051.1 GAF domain-containing protein [Klenkia soli]
MTTDLMADRLATTTAGRASGPVPDALHELTVVVRDLLDCPVSLVSLLDGDRLRWLASSPVRTPDVDPTDLGSGYVVEPTVFCRRVIATGLPLSVDDTSTAPGVLDGDLQRGTTLTGLGARAYCGVPLTAGDAGVVGVLVALDVEPRTWTPAEVAVLTRLGVLASAALGLRRVGDEATRSRAAAETATTQAQVLLALSEALADTETAVDIACAVSDVAARTLGASYCFLGLVDPTRRRLEFVPVPGHPGLEDPQWDWVPVGDAHPAGNAAVTGRATWFPDAAALMERHPTTWDPATGPVAYEATAHLPLSHAGEVVGVLSLVFDTPRSWTAAARDEKLALARYTAQALNRAQLLAERRTAAQTLQLAMLTRLPEPDHLQLAGRYVPSSDVDQVGGDWYDAFLSPDGATCLVIGDVTGHDTAAAAVMGQVRSILRGYGVDRDEDPSRTVARLDHAMGALAIDTYATLVLGRIEQPAPAAASGMRRLRWTNAGHPPPLLLHPDGRVEVLDRPPHLLVGLHPDAPRVDHTVDIPPGATVVLYTDGLVERRGVDLDTAVDHLAQRLAALAPLPLEDLLDELLAELSPGADDDIAILAARFHPEDRPRPAEAGPSEVPATPVPA